MPEGGPVIVREARSSRARPVLVTLVVVLALLVIALFVLLFWALIPPGSPPTGSDETGLSWVRSIYGYGDSRADQFSGPTDVAVAPDGTIWGTDPSRGRVLGFRPDGTFLRAIVSEPASAGAPARPRPEGVGVDAAGNVFVTDYGGERVIEYTPAGQVVREWPVPVPLDVDVQGDRIVVSSVYGVAFFHRDGEFDGKWGMRGSGDEQFDVAHGVAFGEDLSVFVTDTQNARVKAYSPDGDILWIAGEGGKPGPTATATDTPDALFQVPSGMTIDTAGRIVVVDAFDFAIKALDPANGALLGTYGRNGTLDGEFIYPTGIAYDPARDWFVVADTANDRLQVVRIPDSGGGLLSAASRAVTGWGWLWLIPPLLLLAALVTVLRGRRRTVVHETLTPVADDEGSGAEEPSAETDPETAEDVETP